MRKKTTNEIYYWGVVALMVLTLYVGIKKISKKPTERESQGEGSTPLRHPDTAYRQGWDSTGNPPRDTTEWRNELHK